MEQRRARRTLGGRDRAARRHDQSNSLAGTTRCSANAESICRGARSSAPRWRGRWRAGRAIVLLDDALSAVDTHTEAEILRSLREALSGRTALIASHRVSAIRDATWIIVLDEGRIVEQGTTRRSARGRRPILVAAQSAAARGVDRRPDATTIRVGRRRYRGYNQRMSRVESAARHPTANDCSDEPPSRDSPRSSRGFEEAMLRNRRAARARHAQDAVPRQHLARSAHAAHRGDHARRDSARRNSRRSDAATAGERARHHQRRTAAAQSGRRDSHLRARRGEPAHARADALRRPRGARAGERAERVAAQEEAADALRRGGRGAAAR